MSGLKEFLYDWMGGNEVLFYAINGIRHEHYDVLMQKISWLGMHEHFPYYVAGLMTWVVLMALAKLILRKKGLGPYVSQWIAVFIMLGVGYGVNGLAVKSLKSHFEYPRPYVALSQGGEQVFVGEEQEPGKGNASFPSGHVAFTVFMVMALWPVLHNSGHWLGVALIAAMCWSRVALGMHFPADTIGALLISAPLMLLLRALLYPLLRRFLRIKC